MPPPPRSRPARRPPSDPDAPLAAQVDAAALEVELAARSEDIAAGLVPLWAARSLHPHEIAARVSFAAIDRNEEQTAGQIGRRLADDRGRFVQFLAADLAALDTGRDVVDRLVALEVGGLGQVAGVAVLINATATDVAVALRHHAEVAGGLVFVEAESQGMPVLGVMALDVAAAGQLEQLAQRLAVAPHVDLVRSLRDEAVRVVTPPSAGELVGPLVQHAQSLSTAPLDAAARTAVNQADGLGRQAAAAVAAPRLIYASELLDGSTCAPCSLVDGTLYPDLLTARIDYPTGIYVDCEGRERCRGTLVFVWQTEAEPTT